MPKKAHSKSEIGAKLARAEGLVSQGKPQTEISRMLGVSVMTLHRWRKGTLADADGSGTERHQIMELELENARLRRVLVDLVLEKTKLEEALQTKKPIV